MSEKIGVEVSAGLSTDDLLRQINQLGQQIAAANKLQFQPIGKDALVTLAEYEKRLKQLYSVSETLRKRAKDTNQSGVHPLGLNFETMFPSESARKKQQLQFFRGVFGDGFSAMPPPAPAVKPPGGSAPGGGAPGGGGGNGPGGGGNAPGGGSGGGGGPGGPGGIINGVLASGLNAAGPAGRVASQALGTGMNAGWGAGLMGLMGGMLALGVGKIVSAGMEKMREAEDNAIALDTLKRTLGDVNVAFGVLKANVHGGAAALNITYAESEKLATQFAKLGNLSGSDAKTLADELGVGVGLSRAFGLDPSQGMGVMGQMRGVGVTTNTQESRRFALLIGETIGKSGAFAKADEVMDALAAYAASQTRNNMSVANVGGYAGMFSAMVGSGFAGMDPQGAASMLGRVNAALSSGGAKGEASQFFTAQVGNDLGLDPIQTQILREGGAFATNSSMFGSGTAAQRYGMGGPTGDKTFLQASLERLRSQYGGNKGLLAQATANHLGIGINQAMALLTINPNQIGEMQGKFGDLSKFSGSGISGIATALYGKGEDVRGMASSFLGRKDVSEADKGRLRDAMGTSTEREVLAELAAQYEQERTQGSDIRDSRAALDNIKTDLADKLIPISQTIRDGILYMAGGGKKTRLDVMSDMERVESAGRVQGIDAEYQGRRIAAGKARMDADKAVKDLLEKNRPKVLSGEMTQEEHQRQMEPLLERQKQAVKKDAEAREWHSKAIDEERKLLEKNIETLKRSVMPSQAGAGEQSAAETARLGRMGNLPAVAPPGGRSYTSPGVGRLDPELEAKLSAAERANGLPQGVLRSIIGQEIGGDSSYLSDPSKYHYGLNKDGKRIAPHTGKVSTAFGPFGLLESTAAKPGYGVAPLKDKGIDEQIRFAAEYLAARSRSAGSLEGGLAGYGEGSAYAGGVMSKMRGTPIAPAKQQSGGDQRFIFDAPPLEIIHRNERGEFLRSETLQTRLRPATPFGTTQYA